MVAKALFATSALVLAASTAASAATLSPLTSFGGNNDGWRSPGEVIAGDTAGTAAGTPAAYSYLGTGNLERGLAYNPATGNLILVSRSALGNGIRVLSGTSGADVGALNQGSGVITGGTFTTNHVGVANDGAIYVANLAGPVSASAPYKVYRWGSETDSAPTTAFSSTSISGGRLGDDFDVFGSGASTVLAAGESNSSGTGTRNGYAILTTGDGSNYTGTLVGFATNPPAPGDFRNGITFAGGANSVWGRQSGAAFPLRRTSYSGSTGTLDGSNTLTSAGEAILDYAAIAGVPYLATLDANNSTVRVYDATDPANLALAATGTTTSGTLASNGNAAGSIKWGAIDNGTATATLYAMSTNQGIQAFTFVVPEPAGAALIAGLLAPLVLGRVRRSR